MMGKPSRYVSEKAGQRPEKNRAKAKARLKTKAKLRALRF
jgi:hypothetical protein